MNRTVVGESPRHNDTIRPTRPVSQDECSSYITLSSPASRPSFRIVSISDNEIRTPFYSVVYNVGLVLNLDGLRRRCVRFRTGITT